MRRVLLPLLALALLPALAVPGAPPASAGVNPVLQTDQVVTGLDNPWGLAFAPDGTMLFTERPGRWWSLAPPYTASPTAVAFDASDLYVNGETGLMDLAVDPNFAANRRVYTCQGEDEPGRTPRVQVIAWTLSADYTAATRVADPLVDGVTQWGQQGRHGGCRLLFDGDGRLYVGTGDGARAGNPQDLTRLGGKVLRVNRFTGQGVAGNPFAGAADANKRRIWTWGHRNIQGLALRPGTTASVWSVEHGTYRDDEVNRLVGGRNYGWAPGPGYDESRPMTDRARFPNAIRARWSSGPSTIATSGATFLEGAQWSTFDGALAVACLKDQSLQVFTLTGGTLAPPVEYGLDGNRLRTAVLGPDGNLWLTTSDSDGDDGNDAILRVTPVV